MTRDDLVSFIQTDQVFPSKNPSAETLPNSSRERRPILLFFEEPRPFVITLLGDDANSNPPVVSFSRDRKLSRRISRSCPRPVICKKVPTDRRTPEN